jgi:4-hydroxy-3-methylbut-2-enyl diphosphate reductase
METVYEQIRKANGEKKIFTFGPIIHNDEVVKDLKEKGVEVVLDIEELKSHRGVF